MSYTMHTDVSYSRTMSQLRDCFRKWGVEEWGVVEERGVSGDRSKADVSLSYTTAEGQKIKLHMANHERVEDNLRVLYLAVEAMRLNEARGIADTVREAYLQLAAPKSARDPYEVLGVRPDTAYDDIQSMYAIKAKRLHPDRGGTTEAMSELNDAFERIKSDLGVI